MNHDETIPFWRILGDPKRRQIIRLLQQNPHTTGELCSYFDVSRFAIMKHLKVLEQAGLVSVQREGRQRWNILNRDRLESLQQTYGMEELHGERNQPALSRSDAPRLGDRSQPRHVQILQTVSFDVPPGLIFEAFTTGINRWWPFRDRSSHHLYLQPEVGGQFVDAFDDEGNGALYGTVTYLQRNQALQITGSLGLVEEMAVSLLQVQLTSQERGTWLELDHQILGVITAVTEDRYRQRWYELVEVHLRAFIQKAIVEGGEGQ